jgi:hypothetical protein
MPISVSSLLTRVSKTLFDETNVVYAQQELLDHLNAAVAEIVQLDTKAYMVNAPLQCVPGAMQSLPGDAVALVDIRYNCDATGTPGRAVTATGLDPLAAARPDWFAEPPAAVARHYAADPRDPKRFYLWPPQPNPAGYVQVVYQGVPDDVALTDNFPLPDLYAQAAYLFVLYHALLRRDKNGDPQRASLYYQMFLQELDQDMKNVARIQAGRADGVKNSSLAPEL